MINKIEIKKNMFLFLYYKYIYLVTVLPQYIISVTTMYIFYKCILKDSAQL